MKKIIRLTESDLARLIKRMIKENEQDWIDQAQDMDVESDFSKMELENIEEFQELVSFFEENPNIAQEIKNAMESNVSEAYKYYDYGDSRGKKEITRNQYLKRKLINYGIWGTLGAIVGAMMGTMGGEGVLQAALLTAGLGGTVGAELSASSGRERIKEQDEDFYPSFDSEGEFKGMDRPMGDMESYGDEELGQTDKGEEELQDLIEEARDILENECGYDIEEINSMDERDIVEFLSDEGYEDLASEIEHLLDQEGFNEEEVDENWDTEFEKRRFDKYSRKDYRDVPKNPFKHTSLLDFEGTRLSKDDDDDDFDEWSHGDDDEEFV